MTDKNQSNPEADIQSTEDSNSYFTQSPFISTFNPHHTAPEFASFSELARHEYAYDRLGLEVSHSSFFECSTSLFAQKLDKIAQIFIIDLIFPSYFQFLFLSLKVCPRTRNRRPHSM